jgi:predicted XRE-type DNA-binding protein
MKEYKNAFELLTSDSHTLEMLTLKSDMADAIIDTINSRGWTQKAASKYLGISQPRLSNLQNGKISKFSAIMLINILSKLDFTFEIKFTSSKAGIKQ